MAGVALLLFGFIYWQTSVLETGRIDQFLTAESVIIAGLGEPDIRRDITLRLAADLFHVTVLGLFAPDGQHLAGNLQRQPPLLPVDGKAHRLDVSGLGPGGQNYNIVRAVGRRLPDGQVLVIGRDIEVLDELRTRVLQALEIALAPALLLSVGAGALLGRASLGRVKVVNQTIERITRGDLRERLPTRGTHDDLDRLATGVNRMLDWIERLLHEVKGVGDNIAHDLRTPLARARARLERSGAVTQDVAALQTTITMAIGDLAQASGIINALLRIGEIEHVRRRSGFTEVRLADVSREAHDLYQPLGESKEVSLTLRVEADPVVHGDGELLLEALTNLLDNAIKFTPPGGEVRIIVGIEDGRPAIRVEDTGPGIPDVEREAVLRRFYRVDASRHTAGHGLGLSIVEAIVRLHDFRLALRDPAHGTGTVFVIVADVADLGGDDVPKTSDVYDAQATAAGACRPIGANRQSTEHIVA
jgi:signal transduction histidine kinase